MNISKGGITFSLFLKFPYSLLSFFFSFSLSPFLSFPFFLLLPFLGFLVHSCSVFYHIFLPLPFFPLYCSPNLTYTSILSSPPSGSGPIVQRRIVWGTENKWDRKSKTECSGKHRPVTTPNLFPLSPSPPPPCAPPLFSSPSFSLLRLLFLFISLSPPIISPLFISLPPQSRQSAKLFLQSSELGLSQPGECAPHPLVTGGVAHSLAREGDRRVPIPTRGHTLWYSLYIVRSAYN
jgi:hypothetical protein